MHWKQSFNTILMKSLTNQFGHKFIYSLNALLVNGIVNEFTISFSGNYTRLSQYGKMLGCNGLFKPELYINFRNRKFFILVNNFKDLLPELMV